jgi:hypothetical protein
MTNRGRYCKVSLFRLPSANSRLERRQKWLNLIGRSNVSESARICSDHFISGNVFWLIFDEINISLVRGHSQVLCYRQPRTKRYHIMGTGRYSERRYYGM